MSEDPRDDPRWELVRAAAGTPVPTPAGLVDRVLRSVRGLRGSHPGTSIETGLDGDRLTISGRVIVLTARRLATELAARLGGLRISAVALEPDGLEVLVTAEYGTQAAATAARLGERLAVMLTEQLGSPAPPVSVHVIDVHP